MVSLLTPFPAISLFLIESNQFGNFCWSPCLSNICPLEAQCEAGGVHIIQAFFSGDESEEVQIQGRTARHGTSGTYSIILADSEVKDFGPY